MLGHFLDEGIRHEVRLRSCTFLDTALVIPAQLLTGDFASTQEL